MSSMAKPDDEDLYRRACDLVRQHGSVSVSWLQRQMRVGHASATRLVERMAAEGWLGARPLMPWASALLPIDPPGLILSHSNLGAGRDFPGD